MAYRGRDKTARDSDDDDDGPRGVVYVDDFVESEPPMQTPVLVVASAHPGVALSTQVFSRYLMRFSATLAKCVTSINVHKVCPRCLGERWPSFTA